jgi:hypothetical protein
MVNQELPDHIDEFFKFLDNHDSDFLEIFQATDEDVDLKTELNKMEIVCSNILTTTGDRLESLGVPDNIFIVYTKDYFRKRISLDRKSRSEFVNINKSDNFKENLETVDQFASLKEIKK